MTPSFALPERGEGSDPQLLEELRNRILHNGPLPFAQFMTLALYHPRRGYYSRRENPIGFSRGPDFYTAPARHPAFGSLVGRQVSECLERVAGAGREWVEFGPGSGELAAPLLEELGGKGLGPGGGVACTLVESNPHRRSAQEELLRDRGVSEGVRWVSPGEWLASDERVRGCVVANEVLDAMPVHRLVFREGRYQEILVAWDGGPVEVLGPVSSKELLEQVWRECPAPREDQEVETGPETHRWLRHVARRLERGYILILDYGYLAGEMHSPRHQRGTLMAYHRHEACERYLERIGLQDLTAHVNFSSLLETAVRCGLHARGPVPQGRFLLALGALEWLGDSGENLTLDGYRNRKRIQDLFLPAGMGESHKAVVLATPGCDLDLTGLRPMERWDAPLGA